MGRNKSFNLNKFERATFSFTDNAEKLLLVRMPKKEVFDRMTALQDMPEGAGFTELEDALSDILSEILSNNKQGKEITMQYVNENFDFEEKLEIFNQYMDFVMGAQDDPN